ncbi:hypothetical protein GCM10022279_08710 [Comamonas faecalis]|uniref:PepSY domain-containing protein n=1 Tax=Comamonas faecalis TaxID=1387849 RepID=A0ABP7QVU7_9BURK
MITTATRRFLIAAAAAGALSTGLYAGLAQAQTAPAATPAATAAPAAVRMAPQGAQLTIGDIYQRMEAAGMHAIREIEWDKGRYEVKALNAQNESVKLYVNGSSGAIEHTRTYDKH